MSHPARFARSGNEVNTILYGSTTNGSSHGGKETRLPTDSVLAMIHTNGQEAVNVSA